MGRLGGVELTANKLSAYSYTDEEKSDIMKLNFDIDDPRGAFPIIVSELETISNKLESGNGVDVQSYLLPHDMDAAQCFKYHNVIVAIFFYGVAILHAMIETVTHTAESKRAKEAAKKIYMGSELEAAITAYFSTVLPYILVGKVKEVAGESYDCLIGYLRNYPVGFPRGPEGPFLKQ